MATTPGAKPRMSGIPARSGIPTPGRSRAASAAGQNAPPPPALDVDYMSRAFADAIKAHDPSQHRAPRVSDVSTVSTSTSTASLAPAFGISTARRPSSAASSSSAVSTPAPPRMPGQRTKTPVVPRPASRTSDVFMRSASRTGRGFEPGDNVRIESLGYEGTLRYVGEIDGKPGLWAGVELSGGFIGKGKNNGAVNGKQYFNCPPNCGVFVATTKLSAPTVGPGAISRPSSVASHNGRYTPSISSGRMTPSTSTATSFGRITPSASRSTNGRVTPSSSSASAMSLGRVTPGMAPRTSIAARNAQLAKTPVAGAAARARPSLNGNTTSDADMTITPGSRAARYLGMTATQLSASARVRDAPPASPISTSSRGSPTRASPTRGGFPPPSPIRAFGSPLNTPKPGGRVSGVGLGAPGARGRPSIGGVGVQAPKPRVPSAVAMPPPASPSRGASRNGERDANGMKSQAQLEMDGRALQDKINQLVSGRVTPASAGPGQQTFLGKPPLARPDSAVSVGSEHYDYAQQVQAQAQLEQLQGRLDALEYENERLRSQAENAGSSKEDEALVAERDALQTRASELEASLRSSERLVDERDARVESLERSAALAAGEAERARSEAETRVRGLQAEVEDGAELVRTLKEAVERGEGEQMERDAVLRAKDAEVNMLESKVEKLQRELEEEKKELGAEVDELRQAGQETIALYEERLSAADTKRYELEDAVAALQDELRRRARPPSPGARAREAASAAEIDNEDLREQVAHLQRRLAVAEDALEDARAAAEREESLAGERVKRYREKEEVVRKELGEARKELERLAKGEAAARARVAETEEAVRESGVALENARAEIEGLRAELSDLQGLAADGESSAAEVVQRATSERARFTQEITSLKTLLADAQAAEREALEELERVRSHAGASASGDVDKTQLEEALQDLQGKLDRERHTMLELREELEERSRELDAVRKKANRDATLNNGLQEGRTSPASSPQKQDSAYREEVRGLKHIVQELQQDNKSANQQLKTLESENRLLMSETDQLRQELRMLEETLEQTILREESALAAGDASTDSISGSADVASLQKNLKDLKAKYELEIEQVRKKLSEAEMKSARTIHDLNKEITELETLVESKIYREDELERELERVKEKLARGQRKSSKGTGSLELLPVPENNISPHSLAGSRSSGGMLPGLGLGKAPSSSASGSGASADAETEDVCEICERPGHDIFTCDLLKDEGASSSPTRMMSKISGGVAAADPSELFCADCESHGHVAADCPHSLDVF